MKLWPFLFGGGIVVAGLLVARKTAEFTIEPVDAGLKFLRRTKAPQGIVIHHSDTGSASTTQFVLRDRGLSTNFEVDRDGRVFQYGDPAEWEAQATGQGANAYTVGIDLTHKGKEPFTPAQIEATRQLCRTLAKRFKFALKVPPDGVMHDWKGWAATGQKYTLFRHRNFKATQCPADAPVEQFV